MPNNNTQDRHSKLIQALGGTALAIPSAMLFRRALPSMRQFQPLFGKGVAQTAKRKGMVSTLANTLNHPSVQSDVDTVLGKGTRLRKLFTKFTPAPTTDAKGKVVVDAFSGEAGAGIANAGAHVRPTASAAAVAGVANKLNQARLMKGLKLEHMAPKADTQTLSERIRELLADTGLDDNLSLADAMRKRFGGDFVLKPVSGLAAGGDYANSPVPERFKALLQRRLGDVRKKSYPLMDQFHADGYHASAFQPPAKNRFWNKLLGGHAPAREYRVHVVNGEVIPYATSRKGLGTLFNVRTKRVAEAEAAVQKLMDTAAASKAPKVKGLELNKQVLGVDIGFDAKGKPLIYELNPSQPLAEGGGSANLLFPWVDDAVKAKVKGSLPKSQLLQLLAGAAGTGYGGYNAVAGSQVT